MDRILVDSNSIGHAGHQGTVLRAGDQETQAIYAMVRAVRQMRVRFPGAKIICLWDGKSWRKSVCDVYKANRTDDKNPRTAAKKKAERERYKSQAPLMRQALLLLGVPQLFALNLEADDLAAILTRKYVAGGDYVRLISGDRDWLQLVGPNCMWEDHRDFAKLVKVENFPQATGYKTVEQFVQSKALQGDTSDNLPGVGRIGEKGAAELLGVWGDVRAFLSDEDPATTYGKKLPKAFADFREMPERQEQFWLNMRLMNLLGELPAPEKLSLVHKPADPAGFKALCHRLMFESITRDFDNWVAPFIQGT